MKRSTAHTYRLRVCDPDDTGRPGQVPAWSRGVLGVVPSRAASPRRPMSPAGRRTRRGQRVDGRETAACRSRTRCGRRPRAGRRGGEPHELRPPAQECRVVARESPRAALRSRSARTRRAYSSSPTRLHRGPAARDVFLASSRWDSRRRHGSGARRRAAGRACARGKSRRRGRRAAGPDRPSRAGPHAPRRPRPSRHARRPSASRGPAVPLRRSDMPMPRLSKWATCMFRESRRRSARSAAAPSRPRGARPSRG